MGVWKLEGNEELAKSYDAYVLPTSVIGRGAGNQIQVIAQRSSYMTYEELKGFMQENGITPQTIQTLPTQATVSAPSGCASGACGIKASRWKGK